jgi:hypothetical protein
MCRLCPLERIADEGISDCDSASNVTVDGKKSTLSCMMRAQKSFLNIGSTFIGSSAPF